MRLRSTRVEARVPVAFRGVGTGAGLTGRGGTLSRLRPVRDREDGYTVASDSPTRWRPARAVSWTIGIVRFALAASRRYVA